MPKVGDTDLADRHRWKGEIF